MYIQIEIQCSDNTKNMYSFSSTTHRDESASAAIQRQQKKKVTAGINDSDSVG